VELVSEVKICNLHITDKDLIEKNLERLSKEEGVTVDDANFLGLMGNFIGYVNCLDLSKVLDDRGMPAKDLSHHGLRSDHPITLPFLEEVYYVIMKLMYHISTLSDRNVKRRTLNKNLIAYNVVKLLAKDYSQDMEIRTDRKMLGLDKVAKIDDSDSDKDLILEKLIGNSHPKVERELRHTIPLEEELDEQGHKRVRPRRSADGSDEEDLDEHGHKRVRPRRSADDSDEEESDAHRHRRGRRHHKSDDSEESTDQSGRSGRRPRHSADVEEEYTKITVSEYRELLKRRSWLLGRIKELEKMIAGGDDSKKTRDELEKLRKEYKKICAILGKIQLFYAIEHMDDAMVISEIREFKDGFIMVINENNVRYRSIESDVMSLALHVAEAMIKEIIFIEDEEINKTRLDKELSMFYDRHYETLKGNDLLSM
jgi:hypothetical protein